MTATQISSWWHCDPWPLWARRKDFTCFGSGSMQLSKGNPLPRRCRHCWPPWPALILPARRPCCLHCATRIVKSVCMPPRFYRRWSAARPSASPRFTLTQELLTPPMVELLLTELAVDISAEIRARAAEVLVFLDDPRATPVLQNLLLDPQWFVRLRTLRALGHLRQPAASVRLDIRDFLRDPHWQVREAAIHDPHLPGPGGKAPAL